MRRRHRTLTVEEWVAVGKRIKKISALLEELPVLLGGKIPCPLTDRILRFINGGGKFSILKSELEDEMFRQHPGLSNEYLSVFYGLEDEGPSGRTTKSTFRGGA
ncbi:MAG: hypothetical protein ACYDBP_04560 [Leptospirales bacterium]